MSSQLPPRRVVQFEDLEIDVLTGEVRKDGQRLSIPDHPARLLLLLVEKPGRIVSSDELRCRLWPDGTYLEFDHSIHAAVNPRRALGDSPKQPRLIETIARRGYRLLAPVGVNPRSGGQAFPEHRWLEIRRSASTEERFEPVQSNNTH
jgi:DNA-binding winged helix-turn-helix (wHTH) protein